MHEARFKAISFPTGKRFIRAFRGEISATIPAKPPRPPPSGIVQKSRHLTPAHHELSECELSSS